MADDVIVGAAAPQDRFLTTAQVCVEYHTNRFALSRIPHALLPRTGWGKGDLFDRADIESLLLRLKGRTIQQLMAEVNGGAGPSEPAAEKKKRRGRPRKAPLAPAKNRPTPPV